MFHAHLIFDFRFRIFDRSAEGEGGKEEAEGELHGIFDRGGRGFGG